MGKDVRMMEKRRFAFLVGLCVCAFLAISLQVATAAPGSVPSIDGGAAKADPGQGEPAASDDDTGGQPGTQAAPPDEGTPPPATEVTEKRLTPAEVRQLEERLNTLKEQIFESRAKLKQLRDQLVLGAVSSINVGVYHNQDNTGAYRLLTLRYQLDGFDLFQDVNTDGHLDKARKLKVFEGSLLPGEHLLVIDCDYQGRGFGLFAYLNNYTFHVRSRYSFVVDEGQQFNVQVTAYDKAEFLESLKERLKVKFVRETRKE